MYEMIKKYINTFSVTGREFYLADVIEAYQLFENKLDDVIKGAIYNN